jgi:hypothetical protein
MNELEFLKKKIREDLNDLADSMATGSAADYPMYRHMVGKVEGLAQAERHILDLEERLREAERL